MIYFDNAATGGYKPSTVVDGVLSSIRYINANAGRSGHRQSVFAGTNVLRAREELCSFFGGDSPDRVIFTKNCTEALNTAIMGSFTAGGHIVSTVAEHNSVLRPLHYLAKNGLAEVSYANLGEDKSVCPQEVLNLITDDTRLIVINLVSNVTGCMTDIKKITAPLKGKNITVIADGAQACGHTAIDMKDLGIDILCVAGHKGMYAVQGASCMIFNKKTEVRPFMYGGTGSESFNLEQPSCYPERLECGTLNYPAILSLLEGTKYVRRNLDSFSGALVSLTERLCDGLAKFKSIEVFSKPNRFGIVSFKHTEMQSEELSQLLSEKYDIAVRGGIHCAPLMHKALGTDDGGLLRVSLSAQNRHGEVTAFLLALKNILAALS